MKIRVPWWQTKKAAKAASIICVNLWPVFIFNCEAVIQRSSASPVQSPEKPGQAVFLYSIRLPPLPVFQQSLFPDIPSMLLPNNLQ